MSADNGIYIVSMPVSEISDETERTTHFESCPCTESYPLNACRCHEYRVVHTQAIDNLFFDPGGSFLPEGFTFEYGNPREIVNYLGNALAFLSEDDAWKRAKELYKEIMDSEWPILEYGISTVSLSKPFSWYQKEAERQPKYRWD